MRRKARWLVRGCRRFSGFTPVGGENFSEATTAYLLRVLRPTALPGCCNKSATPRIYNRLPNGHGRSHP